MIALLEAKAAGLWSREHIANNVLAGVVVGVVALPLAMAFAIASGARPEQGLYTAIIACLLTSLFGGTRLQIAGPTGAFIAVLSIITAQHGIGGLQIATFMAGIILVAFGAARLGAVIKFIPTPVIVGFTAGIGVIIFVGQWKDFFGLSPVPSGLHFHEKLIALTQSLPTINWATTGLALSALAILTAGPRYLKRIPAPLVAMIAITAIQSYFNFQGVATIGSAFGGIPRTLPSFALPSIQLAQVISLVGPAFTIALLGSIESLLSAVVADGMAGTKHNSNQELIGQGIANIVAPLFGGFASTGAIARTATNIRNGATSPLAGMVHSGFLILVILLLSPLASAVPLCCLSAILFVVAWNMSEIPHVIRLMRGSPATDVAVLVITFSLTVFVDLVVAVNVGVILAALIFMRRMSLAVNVEAQVESTAANSADNQLPAGPLPEGVVIYNIEGPLFFGAAEKLERTLAHIQRPATTLILRMSQVPFVDATGISAIDEMITGFLKHDATVLLSEVRPNVLRKLERAGLIRRLGVDNSTATLALALERVKAIKTVSETRILIGKSCENTAH
ncbi:MAG TPA: SulP family inorganic anion transporter [Steroidobacteraceae bacterium]|nr:SulP family inorganic anion transporter [Steroidobacteraceae bacterium]